MHKYDNYVINFNLMLETFAQKNKNPKQLYIFAYLGAGYSADYYVYI